MQKKEYIINYIPTLSKQHTYTLLAMYPCLTHRKAFGFNTNIFYKIPKKSFLGGKYGTKINLNFRTNSIQGGTSFLNDVDSLTHSLEIV